MFYSPLRYPGGKKRLAEFIGQVCQENGIDGHFVEPFSSGASVALSLLISQSGALIGDILNQEFPKDTSTKTSIELNLAMIKIKHTIKKETKTKD